MNSQKNAGTTRQGRKLLIERIGWYGLTPAAEAAGVSLRTVRKWGQHWMAEGFAGLADRNSRPHQMRSTVDPELRQQIEQPQRGRMPMRSIARAAGRFERPGHRLTGDRRDSVKGASWELAHVAINDHSGTGFVQMPADEKTTSIFAVL